MTLTYERVAIEAENAPGCFLFAAHVPPSNAIMIGVGYESPNALHRKHVTVNLVHHWNAVHYADGLDGVAGALMRLGGVGKHFLPEQAEYSLTAAEATRLAYAIRRVHTAVFGMGKSLARIDIGPAGHFAYVGWDHTNRRFRLGVGRTWDGLTQLGSAVYVRPQEVYEEAARLFTGACSYILSPPPNWGFDGRGWMQGARNGYVPPTDTLKQIGVELVRLADTVLNPAEG